MFLLELFHHDFLFFIFIFRVNCLESDLDDLGIKYSEALLEHEATRRVLTQTSEQLDKENLLRMASEADIKTLKEEVAMYQEENKTMESNLKDLVQKYTNLEDALGEYCTSLFYFIFLYLIAFTGLAM